VEHAYKHGDSNPQVDNRVRLDDGRAAELAAPGKNSFRHRAMVVSRWRRHGNVQQFEIPSTGNSIRAERSSTRPCPEEKKVAAFVGLGQLLVPA